MFKNHLISIAVIGSLLCGSLGVASAKTVWQQDDQYVKAFGRVQLQYQYTDADNQSGVDDLFFRRVRLGLAAGDADWHGKVEIDFGKAKGGNEAAVKSAWLGYKGWSWAEIRLGNHDAAFSRELLTSSKRTQLIERSFVGNHNYGTPDKQLGVHLLSRHTPKWFSWRASLAKACLDPDNNKLDLDSCAVKDADWLQGNLIAARAEWHPMGAVKMTQGDIQPSGWRYSIGVAAMTWHNDDDNNNGDNRDVDQANGMEVSFALRGRGLSLDVQHNRFNANLLNSNATDGLYRNSETVLTNTAIEAGYTIIPKTLEIVGGYSLQDADNYASQWQRQELGVNWFFEGHNIKWQNTVTRDSNIDGQRGRDQNTLRSQVQYVF